MKKFFGLLLALCLLLPAAFAQESLFTLQGEVIQVTQEGILMDTAEHGNVLVKWNEETIYEGETAYAPGDVIIVSYDGIMTRSIPAQITAQTISCHILEGLVSEVTEDSFLLSDESGDTLVVFDQTVQAPEDGQTVRVYYNGVLALSYPGRVGALKIAPVVPQSLLSGFIAEMNEDGILLRAQDGTEVFVIIDDDTSDNTDTPLDIGSFVTVLTDGSQTKSIPAQVYALQITCCTISGTVAEVTQDTALLKTQELGDVQLNFPPDMALPVVGEEINVSHNGAFTMSIPPQTAVLYWETVAPENARE